MRPCRERLAGMVEVDETDIGGVESGLAGSRAEGKKVLTGIAVEAREPKGFGRCRMLPLVGASAVSLHPFVTGHVEPERRSSPTACKASVGWKTSATSVNL